MAIRSCAGKMRSGFCVAAAFLTVMVLTAPACGEGADDLDAGEVTAEKWERIERGMTKDEVRSILGDADDVETSDLDEHLRWTETWSWGYTREYQISFDQDGRVTGKYKCRGPRGVRSRVACRLVEGGD
jgi:SmpA/OmlA family protein